MAGEVSKSIKDEKKTIGKMWVMYGGKILIKGKNQLMIYTPVQFNISLVSSLSANILRLFHLSEFRTQQCSV